ncbi:alpha/beta hydrolase family protein [Luteibacter sp. CQ10]|uniref:alpha/beta hydrolase family protein n=1 Tax=Luteibacter sp. CQ10 TaxID=2805821 RepID=UPI0034A1997B
MTHPFVRPLLAALCLALPAAAATADTIPVADFARHQPMTSPRLSPDGKHFSVVYNNEDGFTHAIAIYAIDDLQRPTALIRLPPYDVPARMTWVSANRLVVARGIQDGSIGLVRYTGELMAVDIDGKNPDYLYGYENYGKRAATRSTDRGWGYIDGTPPKANGHFYMRATSWTDRDRSTLYDVDASSGVRHQMADIGLGEMNFVVGADGVARFAHGVDNDYKYVIFHRSGDGWARLGDDIARQQFQPFAQVAGSQRIYAMYSPHGRGGELVEQDEDGGNRKSLARDEFSTLTTEGLWTAAPLRPFGTWATSGVPSVTYFDPNETISKLHRALSAKFPGELVSFVDFSEDGSQLMFEVDSDRDPGRYMLIDTHTYKVRSLFAISPWLDPAKMSERRPMRFKASDGMELEAILTFPRGKPESGLPMVLLPHGGPLGISDTWFYDRDAQFLASRGYLVLQVNYRGSGNRGSAFEHAGWLNWGTRIQDDLIDGVKWAVGQHYADAGRVCVYGGSFGGYSAMMTATRAPGLFKCAVGYAGIYDLDMMYNKGDIKDRQVGRSYLTHVIGRDEADLAAHSPVHLADKITVPVLLVHGEDDQRAPFAQFKAMKAALDAAHKPYETLTKAGERHGFVKPENVEEFYTKLQAFLDRNIGDGAPATSRAAP